MSGLRQSLAERVNVSPGAFETLGYVVIPDVLTREEAEELYEAFDDLPMIADHSDVIGLRAEAGERVLATDERFLRVATNPRLIDCIRAVVGDDLQLIDYVAMETGQRSGLPRAWHVDMPFFTYPACLSAIAGVYLTNMTSEMGPLHVVPRSHEWRRVPNAAEKGSPMVAELEVAVPAGSAVVFNSQIWHTGTENASPRPRRALFLHYSHYWVKRLDEFYVTPLPSQIVDSDDPLLRQLFGIELAAASIWRPAYTREREKIRV